MKLETFTPQSLPYAGRQSIKPTIGITPKAGVFRFNKPLVENLKLTDGSMVLWHQDQTEKGDWYLEVVKKDGFPLREKKSVTGSGDLVMQSTALARKIFESVDCNETGGRVILADPIQHDKKTLYPVITAMLKN